MLIMNHSSRSRLLTGTVGAIALTLLCHPSVYAQSNDASDPNQCDLTDTWQYRSSGSLAFTNGNYEFVNVPYDSTVDIIESEPSQQTIMDGSTEQIVRMATIRVSNSDPAVSDRNASMVTSTRIGTDAGLLMAVPADGIAYGAGLVLYGEVNEGCRQITGQASIGGVSETTIPFTLERLSATEPEPPAPDGIVNVTGEWVAMILTNGEPDYKHINQLTQRGNQLTFVSGISGFSFNGTIEGNQVTIAFNTADPSVGMVNEGGDRITFPDLLMVRLGSPNCLTYETCDVAAPETDEVNTLPNQLIW